jgi:hypothetical protein
LGVSDSSGNMQAGDRVVIVVYGDSRARATEALSAIASDSGLGRTLVASPANQSALAEDFGEMTAVQEFLIVTASGLTVEALIRAVRRVLTGLRDAAKPLPERAEEEGQSHAGARPSKESITVTAAPTADGLTKVSVEITRRATP